MAFISEINYQNAYSPPEFVEVSISPAEFARVGDFTIATYQSTGAVRSTVNLSTLTPTIDPVTGWYVFVFETPVTSPDHTTGTNEAEAVALVDAGSTPSLLSFYDIGGGTTAITATNGPALGATSVNIPNAPSNASIQFDVNGNRIDGPKTPGVSVTCLTAGSLIDTPTGPRPIETLVAGDLVQTLDNGPQPLRLVLSRRIGRDELARSPAFRPILIPAGALGEGRPLRDMRISQQHRMLVTHPRLALLCDHQTAFIRGKALTRINRAIRLDEGVAEVTYFHLLFDRHEIIFADGSPTESFHPGDMALTSVDAAVRAELLLLFPQLAQGIAREEAAYATLRSWEAAALAP
jgi:hypothetical protein